MRAFAAAGIDVVSRHPRWEVPQPDPWGPSSRSSTHPQVDEDFMVLGAAQVRLSPRPRAGEFTHFTELNLGAVRRVYLALDDTGPMEPAEARKAV